MKKIIDELNQKIENLKSDAYFYEMQICFISKLKETSPEVEKAFGGATFDEIIENDILIKEKILEHVEYLKLELENLIAQKAS